MVIVIAVVFVMAAPQMIPLVVRYWEVEVESRRVEECTWKDELVELDVVHLVMRPHHWHESFFLS